MKHGRLPFQYKKLWGDGFSRLVRKRILKDNSILCHQHIYLVPIFIAVHWKNNLAIDRIKLGGSGLGTLAGQGNKVVAPIVMHVM